jgi:hypothetical protein
MHSAESIAGPHAAVALVNSDIVLMQSFVDAWVTGGSGWVAVFVSIEWGD